MARMYVEQPESGEIAAVVRPADAFLALGLQYCTGREGPQDLVAAHKWFNIAALQGNADARRYRAEISREMCAADIAAAQREARAWLTRH
jgi:TPR repeat protein